MAVNSTGSYSPWSINVCELCKVLFFHGIEETGDYWMYPHQTTLSFTGIRATLRQVACVVLCIIAMRLLKMSIQNRY
ncbi:hypothetical protein COEREDRAFT_82860 [Coemansia reversa NRRL 1564]|uniref:Uncharacterized protein n=1 Tax=Coemansia reversa (strain ATCC 12441 / NRRL 1564) TaxID=763665 RepID=A0A2G5B5Q7_COERN|nr:hypothetical protein COEREDRAFT_82860 [Coemansia reversa NRRL 1564]|eukprot:PIA14348.1 hypothetical protein COEREDRAFT_82860 [Coemansia reversa NRRL 1564]